MKPLVYSIGHSNYSLERLLGLLDQHRIESLVDIRRFPGSRKFPYLNQQSLAAALPDAGMEYHWLEALGGRRSSTKGGPASLNLGLRNESFRNYANYMLTDEFRHRDSTEAREVQAFTAEQREKYSLVLQPCFNRSGCPSSKFRAMAILRMSGTGIPVHSSVSNRFQPDNPGASQRTE